MSPESVSNKIISDLPLVTLTLDVQDYGGLLGILEGVHQAMTDGAAEDRLRKLIKRIEASKQDAPQVEDAQLAKAYEWGRKKGFAQAVMTSAKIKPPLTVHVLVEQPQNVVVNVRDADGQPLYPARVIVSGPDSHPSQED